MLIYAAVAINEVRKNKTTTATSNTNYGCIQAVKQAKITKRAIKIIQETMKHLKKRKKQKHKERKKQIA